MKSKAPLNMMEQIVMVLVFALAAAICLRAFVWSDGTSRTGQKRDQAAIQAESAAECLKHAGGDFAVASAVFGGSWTAERWVVRFDENWERTDDLPTYTLSVQMTPPDQPLLGRATVRVTDETETVLFEIPVAWQAAEGGLGR